MIKIPISLLIVAITTIQVTAQQTYYDVTSGTGNGLRLWSSDHYKIHMGNTSVYHYGPVTDYSIKMNMNDNNNRGWTWGKLNLPPVAAISASGKMQIAGSFTSMSNGIFFGNVGIGTTSPAQKLHVSSSGRVGIQVGGPSTAGGAVGDLYFKTNDNQKVGGTTFWNWSFRTDSWSSAPGDFVLYSSNGTYTSPIIAQADGDLLLTTGNNSARNGNVGIGTTTPNYKLSVNGTIGAKEVKVTSSGWSDFVFESDYALPTLEEVENFIDQHGHLQDIPSTEEVKADGISLGEMDAKLLQKIEELTLYTIKQQKELDILKKENEALKALNLELKTENQSIRFDLLIEIETIKAQLK